MRRGTTPQISQVVYGYDLTGATVYATVKQGQNVITKTGEDLTIEVTDEDTAVTFALSQEDTLSLQPGRAFVQIRWIDSDGNAYANYISEIQVEGVLLDEVIEYEPEI